MAVLHAYLVDGCELGADWASVQAWALPVSLALVEGPPWRPLSAAVQHGAARRLLPVQRPGRRLVPAELGAALAVAVRGAGLAVQAALLSPGARGQPLWDVFVVRWWAALVRAAVEIIKNSFSKLVTVISSAPRARESSSSRSNHFFFFLKISA